MEEEKLNLIQKLAKIRSISDVAKKDKKGFNYTYTDITEILAKVTAGMKKYNVSLLLDILIYVFHKRHIFLAICIQILYFYKKYLNMKYLLQQYQIVEGYYLQYYDN